MKKITKFPLEKINPYIKLIIFNKLMMKNISNTYIQLRYVLNAKQNDNLFIK